MPLQWIERIHGEESMALVHHEPDRSHDLHLCGLAVLIVAIIAASVPVLKFVVDWCFALFQ